MSDRTNLIAPNKPIKYILGSMILMALSGMGMFWLTEQSKKETEIKENLANLKPTTAVLPEPTVIEISEESTAATSMLTPKLSITVAPTIATSEAIASPSGKVATPTPKPIEEFKSIADGFGTKYKGTRKIYEENENSGKRYIFYSYSGNITVHVGKTWSWLNSGRTFSETLLVGGQKTYVYEISNQKIVDLEKGDKKYTIQCVHNAVTELKTECDKFLADFYFI